MFSTHSVYCILAAALTWLAMGVSYVRGLQTQSHLPWLTFTVNYFSYFTILSNLLVAIYFTLAVLTPQSRMGRFFNRPPVRAAIALYIAVTFLIYFVILSRIPFDPGGSRFVQGLLHYATPALYLCHWAVYGEWGRLRWRDIWRWLAFPFVYFIYSVIHGAWSGFYPYPFINVAHLGYPRVLLNSLSVLATFTVLSLLLLALDRQLGKAAVGRSQPYSEGAA
jgi:hypothetical protein